MRRNMRGRGRGAGFRKEEKPEWVPKTKLGQSVMAGEFKSLGDLLSQGHMLLESGIVDHIVPNLKQELVFTGGTPGKGGGARRTATRRTVRMHKSGRRFKLSALVVVGDGQEVIGIGGAHSKENRTAISKATDNAKLTVIRVRKGCGSWECKCGGDHSIPFKATASEGSVKVELKPAPKGVGIVASDPVKKILKLAGIKDIWVTTYGATSTRGNLAMAVFKALKNLSATKGDV